MSTTLLIQHIMDFLMGISPVTGYQTAPGDLNDFHQRVIWEFCVMRRFHIVRRAIQPMTTRAIRYTSLSGAHTGHLKSVHASLTLTWSEPLEIVGGVRRVLWIRMAPHLTSVSLYVVACISYSLAMWSVLGMPRSGHHGHQTLRQWTSSNSTTTFTGTFAENHPGGYCPSLYSPC